MAYLSKQQKRDAEALAYRVGLSKRQGFDGTVYKREQFDLDGRVVVCTYKVEDPYTPIECVPWNDPRNPKP